MRKQCRVNPQDMVQADNPEMMTDFCNSFTPMRDGMQANRERWTERAKTEGLDVSSGAEAESKEKGDVYANLWEKYWNMDPENFIWGIDPNEAPPEVVIEKVVFSPRKKAGVTLSSEVSEGDQTPDGKSGKRKKHKKKLAATTDKDAASRKSPTPSTHSDSGSSSSKSSKACRIM